MFFIIYTGQQCIDLFTIYRKEKANFGFQISDCIQLEGKYLCTCKDLLHSTTIRTSKYPQTCEECHLKGGE